MNTYKKYCANVFVALCDEKHNKGDEIIITTKRGKENKHIVHNLVRERNGEYWYSITRADGATCQDFAKKRMERIAGWQQSATEKSNEYYEKSKKDSDFLSLAEPIKIGHHSERRHRKIIKQAQDNATKFCEFSKKADSYDDRISYWEEMANKINLSMPESIEFYKEQSTYLRQRHADIKSGKIPKEHSYTLTYANKAANTAEKNFKTAVKLWA